MQDVTAIVKQSIDDENQTIIKESGYDNPFWVANVYAPDNSNGYGAWSLIVVYKDDAAKLRNISVYDGFISVFNETSATTLSGFITPNSGTVNSDFFVFAGEGDITLKDIFQSAIDNDGVNVTNRSPSCQNTIGVDVRSFSVGTNGTVPIIGLSQTTTTVKLTSSGDEYLPGLFAFSTDLYEPRVCYKQEFADANGDPLQAVSVGDTITLKTWISNMKKDATDGNLEPAAKVEVELEFDSDNLEYISDSTIVQNIGETSYTSYSDANKTGLADHFVDTNSSIWRLGLGATSTDGGLVNPNATGDDSLKAFVELKTTLLQEGNVTVKNVYRVSYLNTQLNLYFGHVIMGECAEINASLGIGGIPGAFNVVSTSFAGMNDPLAGSDPLNALTTQVSGRAFNVKILALDSDNVTLRPYTGSVDVSIIDTTGYISGDDSANQLLCDSSTPINAPQTFALNGVSSMDVSITNAAIATKSAWWNSRLRMFERHFRHSSREIYAYGARGRRRRIANLGSRL
jgi:trimeric autotransporter adhesin